MSFAAWSSAAVAELPASRFATGSAVLSCMRQIGAVLGIALLVAVLDAAPASDPVDGFRDAYLLMAAGGLVAARRRRRSAASARSGPPAQRRKRRHRAVPLSGWPRRPSR